MCQRVGWHVPYKEVKMRIVILLVLVMFLSVIVASHARAGPVIIPFNCPSETACHKKLPLPQKVRDLLNKLLSPFNSRLEYRALNGDPFCGVVMTPSGVEVWCLV